ncbi:MAG TPA: hypothetical protein VGG03_15875 [Thermoanaerobaculia bacterium]|jgi:hypothetical protein
MNGKRPAPPVWKSPWLWIGLSCGVLVLGVGGCFAVFNFMMFKSYREVRSRIREEPVLMAAEMAVRKDPDVVVVSRDQEAHTVNLRNRKTGERFVLGQEGKEKLRIHTEAGEVIAHFAGPGGLLPGSRDPEVRFLLGSAAGPLPSWVPVAPGVKPRPVYVLTAHGVTSGCSVAVPSGPVEDVFPFYRRELDRKGFTVVPSGDAFVSSSSPDMRSSLYVSPIVVQGGRPGVLLTWSEMAAGNR